VRTERVAGAATAQLDTAARAGPFCETIRMRQSEIYFSDRRSGEDESTKKTILNQQRLLIKAIYEINFSEKLAVLV